MIPPNAGFVNNAIKTCVVEYSINSSLLILSLSLHHKRKTDGKVLSPLSAYIFLIFNTANRPQRSSMCSTSRSNARIPPPPSLCNFQSVCLPYAPRKKPYRFFANSHARVAQQQFRAAYSIIPVETDTATSFNYHKRKTDGKVLSPLSAYVSLLYFNTANRPQRSSTCSTSRSNARTPPPPSLCNFQSVCLPYAPRKKKTVQIFCEQPCACCAATISRGVFNHSRGN